MPLRAPSFHIWIEFGYFCAATSWRHPSAHFFKRIRYVMGSDNNGSLRLAALMSRSLLNIAKRSLLRLMLSCVGLASKHAAG
jgi:hypothetical protein